MTAWSGKTYRRKIIHHALTPQPTEEEATQLLRISALEAIANAGAYCLGFDELTGSQQMALSQLVFQMGTNLQQLVPLLDALAIQQRPRTGRTRRLYGGLPEHWKSVQGTLIDSQWAGATAVAPPP